ncbi:hypothetical protein HD806DRAFT_332266 [Xylariaceae sp. AK1471]|nr:hypothetical protein HD806DRAFT_332266 [Xylariaceae sp. AK1471]
MVNYGEDRCYGPTHVSQLSIGRTAPLNYPALINNTNYCLLPFTASWKLTAADTTTSRPSSLVIPKARNPEVQEAFECAYKWAEKCNKRLLLSIRKNKIAREKEQRRYEMDKILAKAPKYPPYQGLDAKFDPQDSELDNQLRAAEDEYLCELEQLVSRFTSTTKPAAMAPSMSTNMVTNPQDPVIIALEAKFEKISQQAVEQTQQIQSLLEENEKFRKTATSLKTSFNSVASDHKKLTVDYNALKSDHSSLQSRFDTLDKKFQALQSQQVKVEADNESLKKQLQDIQFNTDKKLQASEARLTELVEKSSNTTAPLAEFTRAKLDIASLETKVDTQDTSRRATEEGFEARITGTETKLNELQEKVDTLDVETLDEVSEAWVSADYNLKTQYEEYNQRHRQGGSSMDPALRLLQQEVDSLRKSQANISHPSVSQSSKENPLSTQAIEAIISAKVAAAEESLNDKTNSYCEQRDNLLSEMIEGAMGRIETLEQGGSHHSALEARIHIIEQWKASTPAWIDQEQGSNLAERVALLEGNTAGDLVVRVNRIGLDVGELTRKHDVLKSEVGQLATREWVGLRLQDLMNNAGINPALVNEVRDLQRRIPAIDQAVKVLDSQFQNISTKQLAEQIVRLTNPGFEQRLGKLEVKANGLEAKTNGSDKMTQRHEGQLNKINELLVSLVPCEKRTASPIHLDEPSKKRKLEANGHHPSPLQHQQQRHSSIRHPSS